MESSPFGRALYFFQRDLEAIANPTYRPQISRLLRVGLQQLARMPDVNIQGARVVEVSGFPHMAHNIGARQGLIGSRHKKLD